MIFSCISLLNLATYSSVLSEKVCDFGMINLFLYGTHIKFFDGIIFIIEYSHLSTGSMQEFLYSRNTFWTWFMSRKHITLP